VSWIGLASPSVNPAAAAGANNLYEFKSEHEEKSQQNLNQEVRLVPVFDRLYLPSHPYGSVYIVHYHQPTTLHLWIFIANKMSCFTQEKNHHTHK
jgi:hypothetical protein